MYSLCLHWCGPDEGCVNHAVRATAERTEMAKVAMVWPHILHHEQPWKAVFASEENLNSAQSFPEESSTLQPSISETLMPGSDISLKNIAEVTDSLVWLQKIPAIR